MPLRPLLFALSLLAVLLLTHCGRNDTEHQARVISPQTTPHLYYHTRDVDTGAARYHLDPAAVQAEQQYSYEVRGNLY